MNRYKGTGGTSGIVIGKILNIYSAFHNFPRYKLNNISECEQENQRLCEAKMHVLQEIEESEKKSELFLGQELRKLFETHRLILEDKQVIPQAEKFIADDMINAEWALMRVTEKIGREFDKIKNEYIKSRFNDIRQLLERLMDSLREKSKIFTEDFDEPVILIKKDFSPAEIIDIIGKKVLGIATEYGGEKSHTAIVCASLNIPLVVGLSDIVGHLPDLRTAILDAEGKELIFKPDDVTLNKKKKRINYLIGRDKRLRSDINNRCILEDGTAVSLQANVDFLDEAELVKTYDIRSIGLLRSEIFFMDCEKAPDEEQQYAVFKRIFDVVGKKPITIRTWDLGSDKNTNFFPGLHSEQNPVLGLRAIRLCLTHPDFFKTQLRALIRLSKDHNLKILLPLITNVAEIITTKGYIKEICNELKIDMGNIQIGAMIETPAAAINIREIIYETDFISIGSNDLVQYTLGIDRDNEYVSSLYTPFHPAIMKILFNIITTANLLKKPVTVCGEISTDLILQLVLLGFGEVNLSMNVNSVLITRKYLSNFTLKKCQQIAFHFLSKNTCEECQVYQAEVRAKCQEIIDSI